MAGTLFVVATPIGNLEDISARALRVLRGVAVIAAEDTRHTGHLLQRFGLTTPTTSLHEHNEHGKSEALVARLQAGDDVALVSDAGTPTVSDPGQHLIRRAHEGGIRVEPVPGPSALVAALSASGLRSDAFMFLGFPILFWPRIMAVSRQRIAVALLGGLAIWLAAMALLSPLFVNVPEFR